MVIGVNAGHLKNCSDGVNTDEFKESEETRKVAESLTAKLTSLGHTVINCTDDESTTESDNLNKICELANAESLDIFLSIHFNAGGGKGSEAYTYTGEDAANAGAMLKALNELGFENRGVKNGSQFKVIKGTKAKACLLEVCFFDTDSDVQIYKDKGPDGIATAICKGLTGETVESASTKKTWCIVPNYAEDELISRSTFVIICANAFEYYTQKYTSSPQEIANILDQFRKDSPSARDCLDKYDESWNALAYLCKLGAFGDEYANKQLSSYWYEDPEAGIEARYMNGLVNTLFEFYKNVYYIQRYHEPWK